MKAWMSVSAAEKVSEGRRRAMFLRWKKADLVMWLMCCSKERLLSKVIPRLRMCGENDRVELSMEREKFSVVLVSDLGQMIIMLDLL